MPLSEYRGLVLLGQNYRTEQRQNALLLSRLSLTRDSLSDTRQELYFARRDTELTSDTLTATRLTLRENLDRLAASENQYRSLVRRLIGLGVTAVVGMALWLKGGGFIRWVLGLFRRG